MSEAELSITRDPRPLGPCGIRVFPLAYGCWRWAGLDERRGRECLDAALEAGMQLFDLADVYGGEGVVEELFGRVLRQASGLRDRLYILTKCGLVPGRHRDTSAHHIVRSVEASLRRLRSERIDLFLLHHYDFLTHPEETARAIEQLSERGQIRAVGVSNYSPSQCETLQSFLQLPLVVHQREWSCVWPAPLQDGTIDQCLAMGMGFLAWSPLAGGKLGDARSVGKAKGDSAVVARVQLCLDRIAAQLGIGRPAVALGYLLAHPVRAVPILGSRTPQRIRLLSEEVFRVRLTRSQWYEIFQAGLGRTVV